MKLKYSTLLIAFFISFCGVSQEMKKGFTYLETGKFKQAETFFETVLQTYPSNKTARLCYGRAVGLNGNSKQGSQFICRSFR